jgi:hypothetical protein
MNVTTRTLQPAAKWLAILAVLAPSVSTAQDLPAARAVLDKFATATGARMLEAAPGITMLGTVELPAAGLKGTVQSYMDRAGRSIQVISIDGIGDMMQGTDSSFAWSLDPVTGPRVLTEKEYAERRDQESVRGMLRHESLIAEAKTLARTTMEGQPCIQVTIKWKSGRQSMECYSEQTGLLVALTSSQASQMGDIPYTSVFSNYKSMNGVMLPTRVVQRLASQEFTITFTDVKLDAVDPAKLAVPSEIRALRPR